MADVLIGYSACPLTAEAFAAHGHNVWTCDLLPSRGWHQHIEGDVWAAIKSRAWDFGLFHPMCTYLTVSAAWAFKDPDYVKYPGSGYHQKVKPGTLVGEARRAAQAEAIANFSALLALPFPVACENPSPSFLNRSVCRPTQVVQPNWFGDDASKQTGFWLTKGVPPLWSDLAKHVAPRMVDGRPRWANQTDSGQNKLGPSDPNRWLARSATYPGIASAAGDQWGRWLNGEKSPLWCV